MGASFASPVAASLLKALDLPELVAANQDAYEALAILLATDGQRLGEIKRRLEKNRLASPLFATALTTKYLEAACQEIHDRYQAGLSPQDLQVAAT
jgi:predicted O-linked N-acetylglucosamine transferase (SPINDLY family)